VPDAYGWLIFGGSHSVTGKMLVDFPKGNHFKIVTASIPGLWGVKEPAHIKCLVLGQGMLLPGLKEGPWDNVLWAPACRQAGKVIQGSIPLHQRVQLFSQAQVNQSR
jgi:hypothetical protein